MLTILHYMLAIFLAWGNLARPLTSDDSKSNDAEVDTAWRYLDVDLTPENRAGVNLGAFFQSLVEMKDSKGDAMGEKWIRQNLITNIGDKDATVKLYDKQNVAQTYNVLIPNKKDWNFTATNTDAVTPWPELLVQGLKQAEYDWDHNLQIPKAMGFPAIFKTFLGKDPIKIFDNKNGTISFTFDPLWKLENKIKPFVIGTKVSSTTKLKPNYAYGGTKVNKEKNYADAGDPAHETHSYLISFDADEQSGGMEDIDWVYTLKEGEELTVKQD